MLVIGVAAMLLGLSAIWRGAGVMQHDEKKGEGTVLLGITLASVGLIAFLLNLPIRP